MIKKYELAKETATCKNGVMLYRIRALHDIYEGCCLTIKKGTLGGWIQTEDNLAQDGTCWVGSDAIVMESARVRDSAHVGGNAVCSGTAHIYGHARVYGDVVVRGNAVVRDRAEVTQHAVVSGGILCHNAKVGGWMRIDGGYIDGFASLTGRATIKSNNYATLKLRSTYYTLYVDHKSYEVARSHYRDHNGNDGGCCGWRWVGYDEGTDLYPIEYPDANAKPDDHVIVEIGDATGTAADYPLTMTALSIIRPEAYAVLAGVAAALAEDDASARALALDTGDALAKFTWCDNEEGGNET